MNAVTDDTGKASEPRQRLGRGLAALLGEGKVPDSAPERFQAAKHVPVEHLRASARNPRQSFPEGELQELADSIKERGIIQPIIVRALSGNNSVYEIVAGERRWRAAQRAGLHIVPIIILNISDREALELSIVENVQRADLNALEEAKGYAQLASEYGYNHTDIGRIVGKSRSHIANTLRLLGLPEHARQLLSTGELTAGHARALLSLPDPDNVADMIVAQGLSVRDVEKLSANKSESQARVKPVAVQDPNIHAFEEKLSQALGATVKVRSSKRAYNINITLRDLEQFEFFYAKFITD